MDLRVSRKGRQPLSGIAMLACLGLGGWTTLAQSEPNHYECNILSAQALNDDGKLRESQRLTIYVGTTFYVDRDRGTIVGGPFANGKATDIKVLDRGNEGFSFLVIWLDARPLTTFGGYLQVQEYVAGADKPFLAVDGNGTETYSGLCK
jgi:hypothetical protein